MTGQPTPPYVHPQKKIMPYIKGLHNQLVSPKEAGYSTLGYAEGGGRLTSDDDELEAEYFVCTWGEISNLET